MAEMTGSAQSLSQMMLNAGFPASAIPAGLAIAQAESGNNPNATNHNTNGTTDYGLFQINSIHTSILNSGQWNNPQDNVDMAYQVWKAAGGSWTPWTTYTSGTYRRYLGTTDALISPSAPPGTSSTGGAANPSWVGPFLKWWWGGDSASSVGSGVNTSAGTASFLPPRFGRHLLWVILGILLILAGLLILFRKPIAKNVTPLVKDAATAALT